MTYAWRPHIQIAIGLAKLDAYIAALVDELQTSTSRGGGPSTKSFCRCSLPISSTTPRALTRSAPALPSREARPVSPCWALLRQVLNENSYRAVSRVIADAIGVLPEPAAAVEIIEGTAVS